MDNLKLFSPKSDGYKDLTNEVLHDLHYIYESFPKDKTLTKVPFWGILRSVK